MRFSPFKVGRSLAIDLGTANTLVYIKNKGIFNEFSILPIGDGAS